MATRPCGRMAVAAPVLALALLASAPARSAPAACAGDCDGSGAVAIDELVRLVTIALGDAPASACAAGDANRDGAISIDEILSAILRALEGCAAPPTPAPCRAESCRACTAADTLCASGQAAGNYCCTLNGSGFARLDGASGCESSGIYVGPTPNRTPGGNGCWTAPDGPCHDAYICRVAGSPSPTGAGAPTATATPAGVPTGSATAPATAPAGATPTATPSATPGCAPPAAITPGMITFSNACAASLTLMSNRAVIGTLAANGGQLSLALSSLVKGSANVFMPYPNLTAEQCPAAFCDGWTALGGAPGTIQREGYMWQAPNLAYAAYCNPNLSGRGICALQQNCCGPGMVQDGTFGTTWELTPDAGSLDYPDLSTNYGYGPMDPPYLCPDHPDDCVDAAANIFFNVPIRWSSNMICSCTSAGTMVMCRQCLGVACPDAYQHPTDDKQCACASSAARGYLVELCPEGAALPPPPG